MDKTVYVNWNGLAISAYLDAARVLELDVPRRFALFSLDRILRESWHVDGSLDRVVAYADGNVTVDAQSLACLTIMPRWGWRVSTPGSRPCNLHYFQQAERIADAMIARFYDATNGGFFDTAQNSFASAPLGVLAARRKPLQDSPTPAGNSLAAMLLLRLSELSVRNDLREKAEDTLEAFAGVAEQFGLYAGAYGLALQRYLLPPVQVCIIGEDEEAHRLAVIATARYAVNKTVLRFSRSAVEGGCVAAFIGGDTAASS